jgi:hypothetical protein
MTPAAFLPHCEQRIRCARSSRVIDQPTRASGVISRTALARHAHEEVTETWLNGAAALMSVPGLVGSELCEHPR